jgi:precorrin-3B synthase
MTALALNRSQRRGACPGLSAPMPTGDGLLVRLMPIGTIPLAAFRNLCAAARRHGNGIIEVTGRGSIQVRGLNAASAPRFAEAIAALGIAAEDGIPVHSTVLAGLDAEEIQDAGALAADLRQALARTSLAARLAPKISVIIDGGGALNLDNVPADLRICAQATDNGAVLRIALGGDEATATQIGAVAPADGIDAATELLEVIAQRGHTARAREILAAESDAPFRSALSALLNEDVAPARKPGRRDPIGSHRMRDELLAVGVGFAFGHADTKTLDLLADAANTAGAIGMRAAADRVLMVIGLAKEAAPEFVTAAESLGFIIDSEDPRRHVITCAGAPICASAHIASRALAPLVARIAAPHLDHSRKIHISGCAKGCARAGSAALTIVGSPDGCALIANGSARDSAFTVIATNELSAAIDRYFPEAAREDSLV